MFAAVSHDSRELKIADFTVTQIISKLGGKVMEVMEVMNWEVMNSCSNGSNDVEIGLQNDHAVMKMAHGVMM